ncbi:hypothetical protein Q8A64_18035 [Oxalobacteraceae bacterium R-40]|uniref:Uncharacterized protein n=1 Tax=Keguizhuia sedimenti TaxID=3064264 RepID=A0ABU1BTG2_9BURK|nr:hypothetical protein [Oxalobacteraceae bacterium R-40]
MPADLLRLHAMAHAILHGAALTVAPNETAVWELADELATEFRDWIALFARLWIDSRLWRNWCPTNNVTHQSARQRTN